MLYGTTSHDSNLDQSASYKRKLAQYSLYGHHGRGDEKTEEDIVGGSEGDKKRESNQARDRTRVSLGLAFTHWRELKETEECKLAFFLLD